MDFRVFDNSLQELSEQLELSKQRCFLYGDAHFTTAKVKSGAIEHLELHIERLKVANKQLKFNPVLWNKLEQTMARIAETYELAVIKVQISRGQAERGYGQTKKTSPAIFISTTPLTANFEHQSSEAIELPLLSTQIAKQPLLAGIKHCNRLEQVLIANELELLGAEDGLVLDLTGQVIETSKANIFCYVGGQWLTPDLTNSGVAGVMREYILQNSKAEIAQLELQELLTHIEAAFICNSLIGIKPISRLVGKQLDISIVDIFKSSVLEA